MKKSFPDMVISIVLLAFLTSMAVQVPAIPDVSKGYPIFLLAVSYIMTIVLLLKSVSKMKLEDKQETKVAEQAKVIVPYCVLVALYLFMMTRIGYIVSTIAFMIISLLYLRLKNKVLMIVLSVATTALIYYVFTNFLVVILPRGSWF